MAPDVTIVMTTCFLDTFRAQIAGYTVASWGVNLQYDGKVNLHVADDGSNYSIHDLDLLWTGKITYSAQHRQGVGASLNAGFKTAFETSPYVLYAVDDWELIDMLDINPWIQLLEEREDIGMVRLGPPHPNISGKVEMFTDNWQAWGLRLDRRGYAYGQRPALYHKRFIDAYGEFPEGMSALECERIYNEHFCNTPGPDIVLALPHPWYHRGIDVVPSMSALEPKDRV